MTAQNWGIEMTDMVAGKNVPAYSRKPCKVDDFRSADEQEEQSNESSTEPQINPLWNLASLHRSQIFRDL